MAKKEYIWQLGKELPEIELHSRTKHEVLREYLARYVDVLTADIRREQLRLTLIDGFAGGGVYRDAKTGETVLGSPFLMLQAMAEAELRAKARRTKEFHLSIDYFFIEKTRQTWEFLTKQLEQSEFRSLVGDRIHPIHGEFGTEFNRLMEFLRKRGTAHRVIFILDQYGYINVPMPLIKTIFSQFSNAEVILTFAADWFVDYLSDKKESARIRQKVGLALPIGSIDQLKEQQGTEWRRLIQVALHDEIHASSNAQHYTPFFIHSIESHRSYWLVHFSNHPKAKDVMTELHWRHHNYFEHYGRAGLQMLGYDPRKDYEEQGYGVFSFDSVAEEATIDALINDLPARLRTYDDGVPFLELFRGITNESVATSQILEKVVHELSRNKEVIVSDKEGKRRQVGAKLRQSDLIRVESQKLFFPGTGK